MNVLASVLYEWTRKDMSTRHENVPEAESKFQATPRSLQLLITWLQGHDSFRVLGKQEHYLVEVCVRPHLCKDFVEYQKPKKTFHPWHPDFEQERNVHWLNI